MATLKEIRKAIRTMMLADNKWGDLSFAAFEAMQVRDNAKSQFESTREQLKSMLNQSRVTYRGKLYSVRDGLLQIEPVRQIKD